MKESNEGENMGGKQVTATPSPLQPIERDIVDAGVYAEGVFIPD